MSLRLRTFRSRGRLVIALGIACLVIFTGINILATLESALNPRPNNQTEREPRYLYRSEFRANPDLDYEQRVSDALREIEEHQRELHGGDKSWDIIWQMLLDDAPSPENRGQDSLQMEEQNPEWSYKVMPKSLGCLSLSWHSSLFLHTI